MAQVLPPILIAGPTASGKSQLALRLAKHCNGLIINADALQVYDCWQILTARPTQRDLAAAPHVLYGHVGCRDNYSVGAWLRDIKTVLKDEARRPIIIGGTGLYFTALTVGLADIPEIPAEIRHQGDALRKDQGVFGFIAQLQQDDPETLEKIDQNNPMRLQRAWEVLRATGRGLSAWQANVSPAVLPASDCCKYVLNVDTPALDVHIATRFEDMFAAGALDEVAAVLAAGWDESHPSARAIGAAELVAVLRGDMEQDAAIAAAKLATRQYAKRQRSWFRNRMPGWAPLEFTTDAQREIAFSKIIAQKNC